MKFLCLCVFHVFKKNYNTVLWGVQEKGSSFTLDKNVNANKFWNILYIY